MSASDRRGPRDLGEDLKEAYPLPDQEVAERLRQGIWRRIDQVPQRRRITTPVWITAGAALAAAVALLVVLPPDEHPTSKGEVSPPTLRVLTGRLEGTRCEPAPVASVGGCAQIDLTVHEPGRFWVWADTPAGKETIGDWKLEQGNNRLMMGEAAVTYVFEHAGTHRFVVSTEPQDCPSDACSETRVEVP